MNFAHQDLRKKSFAGKDLSDADFTGADLRGVSFRGAPLTDARFCGARIGAPRRYRWPLNLVALTGATASGLLFSGSAIVLFVLVQACLDRLLGWAGAGEVVFCCIGFGSVIALFLFLHPLRPDGRWTGLSGAEPGICRHAPAVLLLFERGSCRSSRDISFPREAANCRDATGPPSGVRDGFGNRNVADGGASSVVCGDLRRSDDGAVGAGFGFPF